jgi:hypothetical protein
MRQLAKPPARIRRTQQHIIVRDTRNQPNIKHTSPPDNDLCKRHRQLHESLPVLEKGEAGNPVSLIDINVVT